MDSLITKLSKFGALTIEHEYGYWQVGCVVHSPDYSENSYVKVTNTKLFFACRDLLIKVQEEYSALLIKPHIEQITFLNATNPAKV